MCDDFNPVCLPENFVSISRPSKVIERLIEKRRNLHEEAIECMRGSIREINLEVDEMIKGESVLLHQKLQDLKDRPTECLMQLKGMEDMDLDALKNRENTFTDTARNIEATNRMQISTIETFYEFLVKTEKYRTDKINALMKQTLRKVQDIGYQLPYENEEFFGNEIIDLNKMTLNNMQAYEDLRKQLEIRAAHDMQMWSEEILEAKELLKKCFRKLIKKSVSRFTGMVRSTMNVRNSEVIREISKIQSLQNNMQSPEGSEMSIPITEKDVEDWLKQIRITLAALDQGAKHIISLYKNIIVILFNRFFTELEDFKQVIKQYKIMDESEIQEFQSEIYTPTVDELNIRLKKDLKKLQSVWEKSIDKMKETIDVTYSFLKGASHLWDQHFRRISEAQYLVLQDVENMVEINSLSIGEFEAKLNILIDKLRQGPNEKKLNKMVQEVYRILDGIKNTYDVHCNTEIQVVHKYRTIVESEIEVLLAEITRLLTVYPPDDNRDPKKQRGRGSQTETTTIDPDEALLPMQMLYCIFQVDAVKNWMFGLSEAISQYKDVGKSEILAITEKWLEDQTARIKQRLSVKLAFHKPRYMKVEYSIYHKRKMELDEHSERLECHKKAAETRIKQLKENLAKNVTKYTHTCDSFTEVSQNFLDNSEKATCSSAIRIACATLNPTLEKFKSALLGQLDEFLKEVDDFWNELRVSGFLFLDTVKLFREGGNYSTEELSVLQKTLKKLEATVKKQLDGLTNMAKNAVKPYTIQLEKRHAEVILTISEVIKEFEHSEHVERLINGTQKQIKEEMYSLKMRQHEIDMSLEKLVNEFETNVGKHEYIDTVIQKLEVIFEEFLGFADIVTHPQPVILYSACGIPVSEGKHTGDYLKCLYDAQLPEEDNFLSKLNLILYRSFCEIQQYSKDFYNKHHRFHRGSSVMHHSIDECMAEVINKYKGFLIQCEICWIDSCKEYLDTLQKFRNYRLVYLKTFESTFYTTCEEDFQKTVNELLHELKGEKKDVEQGNKKMFDKLKALYGHPNNENLLKELEEQYQIIFVENDAKYSRILDLYKEKIYEKIESIKQYFAETVVKFETISNEDKLSDMIDTLLESYNLKISTVQGFTDDATHLASDKLAAPIVTRFSKTMFKYLTKYDGVVTSKTNLPPSVVTSESTIVDTPETILKNLETTEELQLRKISQFVETDLLDYIKNYDKIWSNEITCIRKLFTVKYDRRDPF